MVESAKNMLERWEEMIKAGGEEIDVEREITSTTAEIIAKTSFGISYEKGQKVFEKLRAMQMTLFKTTRFVGVPFGKYMCPKQTMEAKNLGKEIDGLVLAIIEERKRSNGSEHPHNDLLSLLLAENQVKGRSGKSLSTRELVDECKTFFFGGHETTALALTWSLLLLAMHPEWQTELREEIKNVIGDDEVDASKLAGLKKVKTLSFFHTYPLRF